MFIIVRRWFSARTTACHTGGTGSIPDGHAGTVTIPRRKHSYWLLITVVNRHGPMLATEKLSLYVLSGSMVN